MTGWLSCNDESREDAKAREKDQLRKHINDFANSTNAVELEWFIGAIRHCASVYPPASSFQVRSTSRKRILTPHGKFKALYSIQSRQRKEKLILSFVRDLRSVEKPSLDGIYPMSLLLRRAHLAFDIADSDIRQYPNASITVADEMRHLAGLIEAVNDRVVQTFALESDRAFAATMAEALLRVVEPRTPGLILVSSSVHTILDKDASQAVGSAFSAADSVVEAKWESFPTHALNLEERKSRAVEVTVRQDAEREDDMEDAHDACEDELADDESINDEEAVSADTAEAEKGPSHTSDVSDGKQPGSTISSATLVSPTSRSTPGKTRSGQIHYSMPLTDSAVKAYIALGSNVGDRFAAIEHACRAIDQSPDIRILRTSSLYETEPMYVEDQDRFLNGACKVIMIGALLESRMLTTGRLKRHLRPWIC